MGVRIQQPSASEDRPKIVSTSVVGAVALGVGLWLAHAAMGHPVPEAIASEDGGGAPDEADLGTAGDPAAEPEAPIDEGASEDPPRGHDGDGDDDGEGDGELERGDDAVAPTTPTTPTTPAPTTPTTPAPTTPAVTAAARPAATTPVATPAAPRTSPPPRGTGAASRVHRGRVAYLRCDGAPQSTGPFPCPRDAALEAAVWAAVEQVTACQPPVPPGSADLVLEWDREAGATVPAITTRDTFPDDALRTDAAAVVTCVTPALATLTTTIPGDRIRVGFRFALE